MGKERGEGPLLIWVFPKIGVPQNGWFMMENPIKLDDLGVPLFSETSICFHVFIGQYPCTNLYMSGPAKSIGSGNVQK